MTPFPSAKTRWPEGPLGFPLPDVTARAVDALLRRLPQTREHRYRHLHLSQSHTELNPGERSDVSWISTESVDRTGEVVIAKGMDDRHFRLNPLVTLNHDYQRPPVGKSLWRRRVSDGKPPRGTVGIKAKTHYPLRPDTWPEGEPWLPDRVFALVQAGLLRGKSIGFLPVRVHLPDRQEIEQRSWPEDVRLVIDEWLLLEYACVSLPANQDALVEAVSKGQLGFTTLDEIDRGIRRRVQSLDLPALVRRILQNALDRVRGRI